MIEWGTASDVYAIDVAGVPVDGVTRFHNPLASGVPAPFPAFVAPPGETPIAAPTIDDVGKVAHAVDLLTGKPSEDTPNVPEFAMMNGKSLIRMRAAGVSTMYGFGEVCGPLAHNGRKISGYTADTFAYDQRTLSMYQAHPWALCVRNDGSVFGLIIETTYPFIAHRFDHLVVEVEGPPPAVTLIEGDSPQEVLTSLAALIGTASMPPRWALGFHQSKWNYAPQQEVLEVAQEFRDRKLPADVIWVDIDYMDAFKVFTFDAEGFPHPDKLNEALHDIGWKSAWMIDPGVKSEEGYFVYDQMIEGDHGVHGADVDEPYEGVVWPGHVVYPDFTNAGVREWWAGLYADYMATGIDAVWNDMNEPTTLESVPNKALPFDLRHRADDDLGGPDTHDRYRNIYGMLMTQASYAGIRAATPNKRPFLLTRSTFLGGHRYAATWTGDNVSNWEHLALSIPMALNLGLSGQPLVGPDIGGFAGDCDGSLLARWMGIGCLLPFARNHSNKNAVPQEPWCFGETVEATSRRALERRYRLLPYLYTVMEQATTTGLPIARPAFFLDPSNPDLRHVDTAFLLGDDVYVRCDVSQDRRGPSAPVPTGWRRIEVLDDPVALGDRDLPELYLRPGAALPLGPVVQYSGELPLDKITLLVHPDADGTASGVLYEDAGDGRAYRKGDFRRSRFDVTVAGGPSTTPVANVDVSTVEGGWVDADWEIDTVIITDTTRQPPRANDQEQAST